MRLRLRVHSGNLPFLGGISAMGARYGHLSGPKEIGSLGSGNARILVEFDPPDLVVVVVLALARTAP